MMMMDSDTLRLLSPVSAEARDGKVQRLNTIPLVLVQKIIAVALVTGVYLLPHLCDRLKCNYPESSIVVFLHVAAYVLHSEFWCHLSSIPGKGLMMTRTTSFRSHDFVPLSRRRSFSLHLVHVVVEYLHAKHRQLGYLGFAEETKLLRRLPVVMYAFGTLGLLITQTVLIDENNTGLSPVGFLRRRVSLFGVKLARVEFVRSQTEALLSKQADKIEYLEDHNKRMGQKLVDLTQRYRNDVSLGQASTYIKQQKEKAVRSQTEALLSKQADKIEYLEDHNKRMGQKLVDLTQRMALLQRNPVRS
ncbi:unnamed protein product [Notodromas monacha]|uniref:Uncharacterized protein n=1 Tax=Notodromas monacha TaxID=399045 RepID=A0A7R9BEC3_9CRUS|nr:unnamed protein product [Notodromas monacha]CAG0913237.1 unnamed protein product [Notodromas monacha]